MPITTMSELASVCKGWNGEPTGFAEIVSAFLELSGSSQRDLADEFEAAVSTVSRWANGIAQPHAKMQKLVVAWIGKRATKAARPLTGNTGTWNNLPMVAKGK